jgi:competence protein ComEC
MSRTQSPRIAVAATLVLLLASCAPLGYRWPHLPRHTDGAVHVIVFHIGQADAMLVLHRGRSMLIDAGVTWSKVDRQNFRDIPRRLEALQGHRRLDYFVVTHYHQDHIGLHGTGARASVGDLGLWGLLADEGVTIKTLVDRGFATVGAKGPTQRAYERAVEGWIRSGKVRRRYQAKHRDLLDMGPGLQVEVMAVNANGRLQQILRKNPRLLRRFPPSENDYSIVLKLTKGDFEMITGGDLTGRDVTRAFGPNRISYNDIESVIAGEIGDIEVYRVFHHGSHNSSNPCFVRALRPEVSIFSTGKNGFGHPDPEVYRSLKKLGRVYITSGADPHVYSEMADDIVEHDVEVIVAPDGHRYWVQGTELSSRSEAEEQALPGRVTRCPMRQELRDPDKPSESGPVEHD